MFIIIHLNTNVKQNFITDLKLFLIFILLLNQKGQEILVVSTVSIWSLIKLVWLETAIMNG